MQCTLKIFIEATDYIIETENDYNEEKNAFDHFDQKIIIFETKKKV